MYESALQRFIQNLKIHNGCLRLRQKIRKKTCKKPAGALELL